MIVDAVKQFLRLEGASGLILLGAALLALAIANSPLAWLYEMLLQVPVAVQIGALHIAKPLLLWINDGLMAVFFFLIGLEVKREVLEGSLSRPAQVVLPAVAAVGGMLVPALIYVAFNYGDAAAIKGWAIPTATDIAFALGILGLLGDRAPAGLKVFLLTLAILDDLGAVVIIALFYTEDLSTLSLLLAAGTLVALFALNRLGVVSVAAYLVLGGVLWICVLKSGVHATLAGVALALFIPRRGRNETGEVAPLVRLEHDLHPPVAYGILPAFAFANAGVSLAGMSPTALLESVPLGIATGLFLGKPLGVLGFTWVAVKLSLGRLPEGVAWRHMVGLSVLCGVGFTMSLFIGSLAFEQGGPDYAVDDRLGILMGSFLSAAAGYLLLRYAARPRATGL